MAFVNETERPELFRINKVVNDLGPGQYLPITVFKFLRPNPFPFNSTEKKMHKKDNGFPGPGEYFKEEEREKHKKKEGNKVYNVGKAMEIIKSNFKSKSPYDPFLQYPKTAELKARSSYENFGFNSKMPKFAKDKRILSSKHLGPGTYDSNTGKEGRRTAKKCMDKKAIIRKIFNKHHQIYGMHSCEDKL